MVTKPLESLSPAYRARIERGLAKGKTRQQARGKPKGEHIIRKQREIAQGKFTSSQMQQIRKFARQQSERDGSGDYDDVLEGLIRYSLGDYRRFQHIREKQKEFSMEYRRNIKRNKKYHIGETEEDGRKILNEAVINSDIEFENEYWFYYH